jgi:predicted branched-subunit amino acid permease
VIKSWPWRREKEEIVMADSPKRSFLLGLREALPVGVSFFFLFLAVGVASKTAGLNAFHSMLMSLVVFAAPAQFVVLDLMAHQRPWLDILAATVIINSRFFVMTATLLPYFRGTPVSRVLAALFMLSASTFAVPFMKFKQAADVRPFEYYLGISAGSYPVAVAATGLGLLLVQGLSVELLDTFRMILPVYFATLLAREWPKRRPLLAGLLGFVGTPLGEFLSPAFGMMLAATMIGLGLALSHGGKK